MTLPRRTPNTFYHKNAKVVVSGYECVCVKSGKTSNDLVARVPANGSIFRDGSALWMRGNETGISVEEFVSQPEPTPVHTNWRDRVKTR